MRVVLQRVREAAVAVDGDTVGAIGHGFLVLAGFAPDDGDDALRWMADKIYGLRLFPDDEQKMNRSVTDVGGSLLVVSQFTLYGDARKGRRPSFVGAADPATAERLFETFVALLRDRGLSVATGVFGAAMQVSLINDGPVTLVLER